MLLSVETCLEPVVGQEGQAPSVCSHAEASPRKARGWHRTCIADPAVLRAASKLPRFERVREHVACGDFVAAVVECAPYEGDISDFHLVIWCRHSMERVEARCFPDTRVQGLRFSADGTRLMFVYPRAAGVDVRHYMARREDSIALLPQ